MCYTVVVAVGGVGGCSFWSSTPEAANKAAVATWARLKCTRGGCDTSMDDNVDGMATKPGDTHSSYGTLANNTNSLMMTVMKVTSPTPT